MMALTQAAPTVAPCPTLVASPCVSHSITQTWTDQAIKCHVSGADCASCDIPKGNYSFTCQMAKVVPVLLETLGQPDEARLRKLFPVGLVR
jgi:hypothetical protein